MDILKKNFEKYTGSCIYALVGSDGKRYIGQTKNYYQRMMQHRSAFNCIYNGKPAAEGSRLCEAIKNGITFEAEIIEKFSLLESTYNNLNEKENYYYELYGGDKGTYNSGAPKPPYYFAEYGDVVEFSFRTNEKEMVDTLDAQENYGDYIKEAIRAYMKGGN